MSSEIKPNTQIQSEIDHIIEKALNECNTSKTSPLPQLETVTEEQQIQLQQTLKQLNKNEEEEKVKKEEEERKKEKKKKHKHKNNHQHNRKITWETCHSFTADCHLCGVNITDYEKYCRHLKDEHYDVSDNLEWLTCDICGKMNAHKSNFISHLASHTGKKPFKCRIVLTSGEFCATEASTRQNLQTHILKVHKMNIKHKLQIHKKSPTKSEKTNSNSSPEKKKKKKKKKKV